MRYEVEQKHRVSDVPAFLRELSARGAEPGAAAEQVDRYFAHPCRDFAQTDEALRIRRVAGRNFVTYKGPKLGSTTKTRREIELQLASGEPASEQFATLLAALGFAPVAIVRKRRRTFQLASSGRDVEGAIDEVEGLGTFVELELLANAEELESAQQTIAQLAADLELGPAERRSYLEMLLER
ncbi:MAG: class IV adenylate cyclase [Pirellulales bacterium]|nr:class IV adenylate cyclase [Pirellulales bacterium]